MPVPLESLPERADRDRRAIGAPRLRRALRPVVSESHGSFAEAPPDVVSCLADRVQAALFELLRGCQTADPASAARPPISAFTARPGPLATELLTVLMRWVFLLYAEQRHLWRQDEGESGPSWAELFERLRADAQRAPAALDQRYLGWSHLLARFQQLAPPRQETPLVVPPLSDAVVSRVLHHLLARDGNRPALGSLAVEQLGSLYEAVLGFEVRRAAGRTLAFKSTGKRGAPRTVDLDELLALPPHRRERWFRNRTGHTLGKQAAAQLRQATDTEAVVAALAAKVAWHLTPRVVPAGSLILTASDERRGSGSHYTPRALTEPIVRRTLEPILRQGDASAEAAGTARVGAERGDGCDSGKPGPGYPRPEQILNLTICDPAMGSGAFLLETCRQLGDHLLRAWSAHDAVPAGLATGPPLVAAARRLVACRCLYGVDKNPLAVELARLSLWLLTRAGEPPLAYLDHSLRCGDALVGLTCQQILAFHWKPAGAPPGLKERLQDRLDRAAEARIRARELGSEKPDARRRLRAKAERALRPVRGIGDACVSAFFGCPRESGRQQQRRRLLAELLATSDPDGLGSKGGVLAAVAELRHGTSPLPAFHWELEFPEVFASRGGFDACVGNPPFAGKNTLAKGHPDAYRQWLQTIHEGSHGNADLVAHFFRRAFGLIRHCGTLGFLATNTVGQGDTRATGLAWIRAHHGDIYHARRRLSWPGSAAVVASVVHIYKGAYRGQKRLDGRPVDTITAFLVHRGWDREPQRLKSNAGKAFQGHIVLGMGFTFDDRDRQGIASPLAEMHRLIARNPGNAERILPYLGGEEVHASPTQAHHRFVIDLSDLTEDQARAGWPELLRIVERRVKPVRTALPPKNTWNRDVAARWWQFAASRRELNARLAGRDRVLVTNAQATPHLAFVFCRPDAVFANSLNVITTAAWSWFTCLQSRIHEAWARFLCSSMKDDLRYNPSDCFLTFPFPSGVLQSGTLAPGGDPEAPASGGRIRELDRAGREYHEFRAVLMIEHDQGLTKTYNRFHDPRETSPAIEHLRQQHAALDRAVFQAYGWHDLVGAVDCEFRPDPTGPGGPGEESHGSGRECHGAGKGRWRLSWPEDVRAEVLARLLERNETDYRKERSP